MGDSIKSIVDSIKKHAGFKRLAVYSIQSLCKKCCPPSNGWQQNAVEAFEAGATEAIAVVVEKNHADADLFLQAITQLQACAVSGNAAGLLTNGALATIIKAFNAYYDGVKLPSPADAVRDGLIVGGVYRSSGKDAEGVAVTESFLRLLAYVSLQARAEAATSATGIIPCILGLLPRLPTPGAIRLALTALESLGRSSAGAAALTKPDSISALLAAASQLFGVEASAATEAATPAASASRLQRVQLAGGSRGPASPTAGSSGLSRRTLAQLNGHLDPAFRLLDRLSRDDAGLKALRESSSVSSLAVAVEWAQSQAISAASSNAMGGPAARAGAAQGLDPAVGATGVRLLARVLGNDLSALTARVAAGAGSGSKSEADFAASLLASLATDPDVAGRLVNGMTSDNKSTLEQFVELLGLKEGNCTSHKSAAALCTAIRRVAAHSLEFGDSLVAAGAVTRLMATARAMASSGTGAHGSGSASTALTEALMALADLVTTPEDVTSADANGSGLAFLLGLLAERGPTDPACAAACLAVIHAFQCNGYDASALAAAKLVQLTTAAISSVAAGPSTHHDHMELQVVGTAVLAACAMGGRGPAGGRDEASVTSIVQSGALALAIANLELSTRAMPGPAYGAPGSFSTGAPTRLLTTSAAYIGRPSLAVAGVKATQRLSLHAASHGTDSSAVGEMDGEAAAAAAMAGSHPAAPTLAAASMHLLALLCGSSTSDATSSAKKEGMVRDMLAAYARHGDSDSVHDAFTDLVECTTGEDELAAAVMAAARDTAVLKGIMAAVDPALLSIAESDLGREGVINTGAGGQISISAADADDGAGAHEGKAAPAAAASKGSPKELPGTVAQRIAEALCLLQASTCSARLSGILANAQGVPVIVRVLGIVSVVKGRPDAGGKAGKGRGKAVVLQTGGGARGGAADPEAERTLPESLQDEILVRCCSTLTGLARIAMDWRVGTLGLDPVPTSMSNSQGIVASAGADGMLSPSAGGRSKAASASSSQTSHRRQRSGKTVGDVLAATQATLAASLYRPVVSRILVKAVNSRTNLPGTLSAAAVCLGVLSLGRSGGGFAGQGESSALLDTIIAQGGVEAIVGGMRAHPASLPALQAVSNALACIAITGRGVDETRGVLRMPAPPETIGSAAVATRGATREIIRALVNASAAANGSGSRWYGQAGQASLCSLLRVLLVVAETPKGADILRKQGTVDALIATLDSGSAAAGEGEGESKDSKAQPASAAAGGDSSSGGTTVASALAGDVFGGALAAVTDTTASGKGMASTGTPGADAAAGASSLGGQGPEASELILAVLARLMDSKDLAEAVKTVASSAEKVATGALKMAAIQLCKLALTTIFSLAGKDNGLKAGGALWTDALTAVASLVTSFVTAADAVIAKAGNAEPAKLEVVCRAAQVLLPAASNTLAVIAAFRSRLDLSAAANAPADGQEGAQAAGPADLVARWSAQIGAACTALVSCVQVAAGVRGAAGKGGSTPSAAKTAIDRLSTAFSSGACDALAGANNLLLRDVAAGNALLAQGSDAKGPVAGLIRAMGRMVDDGDADGMAAALDLLYSIAKVQPAAAANGASSPDGLTVILGVQPPCAAMLTRALNELVGLGRQSGASGAGCALLLLARMAHRQTDLVPILRTGGISDTMRQAVQRFCSAPADEAAVGGDGTVVARDVEGLGAARVLEGAALLQSQLFGRVGSGGASVHEADLTFMARVLSVVRDEPGGAYTAQAPKAMTAVCEMVCAACSQNDIINEDQATAARQVCTDVDARGLVVASMSSARADARLLKAGARALAALGGGSGSGAALETRRTVAYLRRAVGLRGIGGLVPDGDPAFSAGEVVDESPTAAGANGLASPSFSPNLVSPSAGAAGPSAAPTKSPADALAEMDTCVRNLSAAVAGEASLTPAAFRYLFDTLTAVINSTTAAQAAVASGSVTVGPVTRPAGPDGSKPHHHGTGSASTASSRASMRVSGGMAEGMRGSRASIRPGSIMSTGADGPRGSPDKEGRPVSQQSQEALQAAFLAQCSSVIATAVQGLSRLAGPTIVSNPSPADNTGHASARPELVAALGLPQVTAVWDATPEEVARLGEPRGTASHRRTALAHEAAAALAKASGKAWPACTAPGCPIASPVTAAELVDGLVLALGHRNSHVSTGALTAGHSSSSSSSSVSMPTFVEGYSVTTQVADSISKAVLELLAGKRTTSQLFTVSTGITSPRPTDGGATVSGAAQAELVWAMTARGLVHSLTSAVTAGQAGTDQLAKVVSTPSASSTAKLVSSVAIDAGAGRSLREPLAALVRAAAEPQAATLLAIAATGGMATARASVSPASQGSSGKPGQRTGEASPASQGGRSTASSSAGSKAAMSHLGFTACPAAGHVEASPVAVLLQLLLASEALTRPDAPELARRLSDMAGAEDDSFAAAATALQQLCSGEELTSLVKGITRPEGFSMDASPVWLLVAQCMDSQPNGGLTRLAPTSEVENACMPSRAGSLACMRVTGALLDSLLSCCTAESGQEASSAMTADAVLVKGGLGQAAALLASWAAAAVATVNPGEEHQAPLGLAATSPVARRSASMASAPAGVHGASLSAGPVMGAGRLPGVKPAVTPLEHVSEGNEDGEGVETHETAKTAPAAGGRPGHTRGQSSVSFGPGTRDSKRLSTGVVLSPETEAAYGLYKKAAQAAVFASVRVLGHMDLAGTKGPAASDPTVPGSSPLPVTTPSGATATDLASLLSDDASLSLFRSSLRQDGADVLAAAGIQVMRRSLGLTAAHSTPGAPVPPATPAMLQQVEALAVGGVFARVCLALGLHSSSHVYAAEAFRLLDDTGRALAAQARASNGAYTGKMMKGLLGLTGGCLKAIQSTVKRLGKDGDDEYIRRVGETLVSALSDVFSSVSAKGFLDGIERAVTAVEGCGHVRLSRPDGTLLFVAKGPKMPTSPSASLEGVTGLTDMPEPFTKMLADLEALQKVSSNLEPEAVPVVPGPLIKRVVAGLKVHAHDARVAGILAWAIARACENPGNHGEMTSTSGAVEGMVDLVRWHKADAFVCEAIASSLRPLSVQLSLVQTLKKRGVVPALVDVLKAHNTTLLPRRVAYEDVSLGDEGGAAKEARQRAHRALMRKLMSPTGTIGGANMGTAEAGREEASSREDEDEEDTSKSNKPVAPEDMEPRIAHFATQSLANIACDNVPDGPTTIPNYVAVQQHLDRACPGGVARLVAAGGIEVLIEVMKSHLERPRVLEDALCAMSNIAYSCDGVRLLIGRTAAPLIVSVLRVFNSDPRTFSMALRTVGNLTRCDENIVSVVSAGVIEGIVEGMAKNVDDPDVLKLSADVVGNLASIDESVIDRAEGLRQLKAGLKAREEQQQQAQGGADDAKAAQSAASRADRMAGLDSLQDAVACLLLDDKAHVGLRDAMVTHATDAAVISACLRSLEYMSELQPLVERMEEEASMGKAVCQVMRSCDFDPELTVRGARLLAQMLRYEGSPAKKAALEAGAGHVLLSAVETHRLNVETFSTVLKVVLSTVATEPAVLTAAKELDAPATVLSILMEAGKGLTSGQQAKPQSDHARTTSHSMRGVGVSDTLTSILPEKALTVVRQALLLLGHWAAKDAVLAGKMATMAVRTLLSVLAPPAPGSASEGRAIPYRDAPLLEAALGLVASIVTSSPTVAEGLAKDGEVMRLVSPLPGVPVAMDRQGLVENALVILGACGTASPAAALAVVEANGHGVASGIAVHWALKRAVDEPVRRAVYDKAGFVLKSIEGVAEPARREKAAAISRDAAAAALAGAPAGEANAAGAATGTGAAIPNELAGDMRTSRPEVVALSPRSRDKDDKHWVATITARTKEAERLAPKIKPGPFTAADLLEDRAGLIPWALFPTAVIEKLAGGGPEAAAAGKPTDVPVDVWFLPSMARPDAAPKVKCRRMRLGLSDDLQVLTWSYTSRRYNKVLEWVVPLATVLDVRPGVPAPSSTDKLKKPVMALKHPKPARGIVLEDDKHALLHIEAGNAEEQDRLLRTFSVLVQYARARAGAPQPLPDLPAIVPAMAAVQAAMPAVAPMPAAAGAPLAVNTAAPGGVVDFVGENVSTAAPTPTAGAGKPQAEAQQPTAVPAGSPPA